MQETTGNLKGEGPWAVIKKATFQVLVEVWYVVERGLLKYVEDLSSWKESGELENFDETDTVGRWTEVTRGVYNVGIYVAQMWGRVQS